MAQQKVNAVHLLFLIVLFLLKIAMAIIPDTVILIRLNMCIYSLTLTLSTFFNQPKMFFMPEIYSSIALGHYKMASCSFFTRHF